MSSSDRYTEAELQKRTLTGLRRICRLVGAPSPECGDKSLRKADVIQLILKYQSEAHAAKRKTHPKAKPKSRRKPKAKANRKTPSPKIVKTPAGKVMVVQENLERLTTGKLKTLMRREGIQIPEFGTGKGGGVLKKDLILVITDYRARAIGGRQMVILAPRKTPSHAKTPTPPPAVVEVVKMRIPAKYSSKSFEELQEMCEFRGIEAEKCQLKREELITVLMEWDRIQAAERKARMKAKRTKPKKAKRAKAKRAKPKKAPSKRKTLPKKTPSPATKSYKCGTKEKPKCPPGKICDVVTGSCLTRTKAGMGKRAREAREKKYGVDYYFDEEHGLVGRKQDVLNHLEYWGLIPPEISTTKPRTPTPKRSPKRKTKKCTDKEDPLRCDEGEICSASSGKCIKDTARNRKNRYVLITDDGRTIVGAQKTIEKLQTALGGTIKEPGKKPSPPRKTKSPTTDSGFQKRLSKLLEDGEEDEDEARLLDAIKAKKKKTKPKRTTSPKGTRKIPPKPPSYRLQASKQDIAVTFANCIASLT